MRDSIAADTVARADTKSRVYHFSGTGNFGNTKQGAFIEIERRLM